MQKELIAVITGDIVASRDLSSHDLSVSLQHLSKILTEQTRHYHFEYEMYRGDSFQAVCFQPENAIRIASLIYLKLKASEPSTLVRQSIGFGLTDKIRSPITTSSGNAFIRSGTNLDRLKKAGLVVSVGENANEPCIDVLTRFLDDTLKNLTGNQSEALAIYLENEGRISHQEIANIIGKGRAGVTKLLNAANYDLVNDCIDLISKLATEEY